MLDSTWLGVGSGVGLGARVWVRVRVRVRLRVSVRADLLVGSDAGEAFLTQLPLEDLVRARAWVRVRVRDTNLN